MAADKPNVAELVGQMPEPDQPGQESKFTGPEPATAERIVDAILAGGKASLVELIDLVRDISDPQFKSYKAEYLLHVLAVSVGRQGREPQRALYVQTLASELASSARSHAVKVILVRRLQTAGTREAVKPLGQLLSDPALCQDAAAALTAIGGEGASELRKALPKVSGQCRLIIVQSLGALADRESAGTLRKALEDPNLEVRLAAAWGLARLADAKSVGAITRLAETESGYARIKVIQSCLLLAERLAAAGRKADASRIYTRLRDTVTDPKQQYVRDAASRALAALSGK